MMAHALECATAELLTEHTMNTVQLSDGLIFMRNLTLPKTTKVSLPNAFIYAHHILTTTYSTINRAVTILIRLVVFGGAAKICLV